MNDLMSKLKAQGVDRAMLTIGLDSQSLFGRAIEAQVNPYRDHDWQVREAPGLGFVVNAVPRQDRLYDSFWEEWFQRDGVAIHHILYLKEPAHWDEIFDAPEHDEIHPPLTLGKSWYVVDDHDMHPILAR